MDKDFVKDVHKFYAQVFPLRDRARRIIREFVEDNNGAYEFDTDNEDVVWVDEECYATKIIKDNNDNILVFNSNGYSEYLHDMSPYDILDLALYCAENANN